MKIFTNSQIEIDIKRLPAKLALAVRRRDSNDIPLAYSEFYVLKKKKHGMDDPYFFGGGSLHAPEMVMDFDQAVTIRGDNLNFMNYDWTRDWTAISLKRPSDEIVFGLKKKTAQVEENRKELEINPSTSEINPLDGKSNDQARRMIRKIVGEHSLGLFSDEYWLGPKKVFDSMHAANLNWHLTDTQYGVSPSMQQSWTGEKWRIPNDYKVWKFEVNFTNNKGRPTTIYGTLTAHGASTMDDPLSKYDMSVVIG